MTDQNIKRITLAQILKMKDDGELYHDPKASENETMGAYFWTKVSAKSSKTAKLKPSKTYLDVFMTVPKTTACSFKGKCHQMDALELHYDCAVSVAQPTVGWIAQLTLIGV